MIGLEYIVKSNGMEFIEVANYLNISKKTVSDWINKRRKIPEDRIKQLLQYFDLKENLFQKELNNQEKIIIHKKIIDKLNNR